MQNLLGNPEYAKWDKNVKKYEILEKTNPDQEYKITRKHFFKPIFFVSERDKVEKTYSFTHEGVLFHWGSSVEEGDFFPLEEEVIRIKPYVSLYAIRIETNEVEKKRTLIFTGFNQADPKIFLPEWIFNVTIPTKAKEWYKMLREALEIYNEKGYEGLKNYKKA